MAEIKIDGDLLAQMLFLGIECVLQPLVGQSDLAVWDVTFDPSVRGVHHRRDLRREDAVSCWQSSAHGYVVDVEGNRARILLDQAADGGFQPGETIVGPDSMVIVTSAARVEGLALTRQEVYATAYAGRFEGGS